MTMGAKCRRGPYAPAGASSRSTVTATAPSRALDDESPELPLAVPAAASAAPLAAFGVPSPPEAFAAPVPATLVPASKALLAVLGVVPAPEDVATCATAAGPLAAELPFG